MSRFSLTISALLALAASAVSTPTGAHAAVGEAGGSAGGDNAEATASWERTERRLTDQAAAGPVCDWQPATLGHFDPAVSMTDTTHIYRDATTTPWGAQPGPDAEQLFYVRCPPELGGSGWRWHTPGTYIDPQVVIDAAYDSARASVPLPDLDIWPIPEAGVPVNYGMWFALHDPGVVSATAQAGPVWATVTATHQSLSVDLDNGTVITCDGFGTPHPQTPEVNRWPNPYAEGPCGYTYQYLSELGIRHITITAHWTTHLVTSTGLDHGLDPIDRPTSFDYEVYEIVTVLVPGPDD